MFFKTMKKSALFIFAAVLLSSCSSYQKLLRSDDSAKKYTAADSLYKAGKYKKALALMEQIVPAYRGKPQAEPLMFRYANTFYNLEDFYLSGYQFERFVISYPKSDSVEIASYRSARSYYELSPRYSLDQKDTYTALEKLQGFVDKFPNSEYRSNANAMVVELKEKLEKKDYETANQFLRISDYKAAIESFENFILDHPGSKYRQQAFYGRMEASYLLAINSVPYLVQERLNQTKKYYQSFLKYFKEGELKQDADEILKDVEKRLSQYNTEN
ncbi:MAG TPA: outer membrane protein assembly factor BamD [Flavobacteriaceae bacterium]|nr:outer membrane protein assembly factor BamD [Flavobacteriaceae bacterium]